MQFFKNICVILSNFLLEVHIKTTQKTQRKSDFIRERKLVAKLIMYVLVEKLCVREALLKFPKNCDDKCISVAWHALMHFEADEDISVRDKLFKDVQVDFLEGLYNILSQGHDLPEELIDGYNIYHSGVDTCQCSGSEYFWHIMKKNISIQD